MTAAVAEGATPEKDSSGSNPPSHSNTDVRAGDARSKQCSWLPFRVALLTGGRDKPYALGLAAALISQGLFLDFIGSDEVNSPDLHTTPQVNFLNLRGDQRNEASLTRKVLRVFAYYMRLIRYAATAKPTVFHVLWNNKFDFLDRTLLMLYYKLLHKRVALTAHNVNAGKRDGNDSYLNRLSLRFQYRLADHIFVHTRVMKNELVSDFGLSAGKVTVIPFGINDTVPDSKLTRLEAKRRLGAGNGAKTMLFFGHIAPYKGLEYLIAAMAKVTRKCGDYRLIIAGRPKRCEKYWSDLQQAITRMNIRKYVIEQIEFIPDEKIELFFKGADVLMLPYAYIFQSGVLFLAYNFGLPVIAADVGSLKEDIIEGKTGFLFRAQDPADLARTIEGYFASELYKDLENRRQEIRDYAEERHSWAKVGDTTMKVYAALLQE